LLAGRASGTRCASRTGGADRGNSCLGLGLDQLAQSCAQIEGLDRAVLDRTGRHRTGMQVSSGDSAWGEITLDVLGSGSTRANGGDGNTCGGDCGGTANITPALATPVG